MPRRSFLDPSDRVEPETEREKEGKSRLVKNTLASVETALRTEPSGRQHGPLAVNSADVSERLKP
ncbi:hypothetical protein EYF80_056686 [Liparis tanakae]|uniref:Uncharacterized protein n=1 Tax=Liparis tanakae TaxID=230148 RepID=A0A4Z2EWH3_9TELE|nr:hypothetical protein EYF80_056686 [Liparis tanakae]